MYFTSHFSKKIELDIELKDAMLQNGFLAKVTAMMVLFIFSVGLVTNIGNTTVNSDIITVMSSIIAFTAGYLFSKRDKKG